MEALIVYPENIEQLTALKAIMQAMKIAFEQKSEVYPQFVIKGVKESLKQVEDGDLIPYHGLNDLLK
ncbi:MAG: DUF2683 family protein [Bacteroidota bacterium]|uniref:Uncharacterized protein n=1 Tax=Pedobacter cryotolerans TaxID=2571270 RepID=A0A4U1C2F6_9SPHI|nr:DUF2683 family protein [Pedobacter cryotolerans]TKB99392.1 hypothetical protein FA045_12975 [Pedobacter cryotolerans]